jgi:hypothetical protein
MHEKLHGQPLTAEAHTTRIRQIVAGAVVVLDEVLYEADNAELVEFEMSIGRPPSCREWLVLGIVITLMTTLTLLPT